MPSAIPFIPRLCGPESKPQRFARPLPVGSSKSAAEMKFAGQHNLVNSEGIAADVVGATE
jgi:hypothetical protein